MSTQSSQLLNIYSVLPFSGGRYEKNFARLPSGAYGCAICGKPVARPYLHSAVVVRGGDWARTINDVNDEGDPGYMGVWGIGPDCHRKHLLKAQCA